MAVTYPPSLTSKQRGGLKKLAEFHSKRQELKVELAQLRAEASKIVLDNDLIAYDEIFALARCW